jgi:hypothetical protein
MFCIGFVKIGLTISPNGTFNVLLRFCVPQSHPRGLVSASQLTVSVVPVVTVVTAVTVVTVVTVATVVQWRPW